MTPFAQMRRVLTQPPAAAVLLFCAMSAGW
jgi:hypothetical protein